MPERRLQSQGTRILCSVDLNVGKFAALQSQAELLGAVRSEVWQRFGSLRGVGARHRDIRSEWVKTRDFSPLPAKAWKETLRDALDDIRLYEAAAKEKVRQQIHARFSEDADRKRYFGLLKSDGWITDPLLCRWMRKAKKHGQNHTHNQIVVEAGVYSQFKGKDGNTWLKVPSLIKGQRIAIPLNSKVTLRGTLRLILRGGCVEVHYFTNGRKHGPCGTGITGLDKGYTEVLADSDGQLHGIGFGKLLTPVCAQRMAKGKARNKLYAIAQKASPAKRARIEKNNLGTLKRDKLNRKTQAQIRSLCFDAAHAVADKSKTIVVEDLTSVIPKKHNWKQFNRQMNQWTKRLITEALTTVSRLRGSELCYVNAAYTSQMDSTTGRLEGARKGDKFYHVNGEVGQADVNAACNVKQRLTDKAITRYMPYRQVKALLLSRLQASKELPTLASLVNVRPSLQDSSYTPVMDINRERNNVEIETI